MAIHPYPRLYILPSAPDNNTDETLGYEAGDTVHVLGGLVYICRSAADGAAIWNPLPVFEHPFVDGSVPRWDDDDGEFKSMAPVTGAFSSSIGEIVAFGDTSGKSLDNSGFFAGRIFLPWGVYANISPLSATGHPFSVTLDRNMTLLSWSQMLHVLGPTPNDGTNNWLIGIYRKSDNTLLNSISTNGQATGVDINITDSTWVDAAVTAAHKGLYIQCTKNGTPGNLYLFGPIVEAQL